MSATDPILIAIDPGPEQSGWVRFTAANHYDNDEPKPIAWAVASNEDCIELLVFEEGVVTPPLTHLVVEMTATMGNAVPDEIHRTTLQIGRFWRTAEVVGVPCSLIKRHKVKSHLCDNPRARDSNIRARLIDLYGGKDQAIGRKASPGPLYQMKADCWQALALAVTWWETCRATAGEVE